MKLASLGAPIQTVPVPGLTAGALSYRLSGEERLSIDAAELGLGALTEAISIGFWVRLSAEESDAILEVRAGRIQSHFETAPERTDEIWYSMEAELGDGADGQVFEEGAWAHIVLHFDRHRGIQTVTNARPSLVYRIRQPADPRPLERVEFSAQDTAAVIELSDIQICDSPLTPERTNDLFGDATEQDSALSAERLEGALDAIDGHLSGSRPLPGDEQSALVDALSESM